MSSHTFWRDILNFADFVIRTKDFKVMALVYIVQTCDKLLRQLQDDEVSMIP